MGYISSCLNRFTPKRSRRAPRGFTLLELLIVLVIAGVLIGLVSINAVPDERRALENDAQRIALLLQLAREEAIIRNRPVAFEAQPDRYRFLVRDGNEWKSITQDEMLREREFQRAPVALSIDPPTAAEAYPLRIVFGREPVDKPFTLTLSLGNAQVAVRADGVGNFTVQ